MDSYSKLEQKYAEFAGTRFAVSCSSGTAALHLALVALGIGPGDEVIVPDFTMAACGFAVSYTGAKVVTVDCDNSYTIDVSKIEEKITEKTKAIMPVHIYGRLCNMSAIKDIARRHNLKVIEDGCEAQGATNAYGADITCFSFYKNKIIHAEEGGIVCTNDPKIAEDVRDLKNMAFGKNHDYFHERIGFNYRMANSQAKMALESLEKYPQNALLRREAEKNFDNKRRNAVWVLDTLASSEEERDSIVTNNPKTRKFFKPLSTMPMWKQVVGENALKYSKLGYYHIIDLPE